MCNLDVVLNEELYIVGRVTINIDANEVLFQVHMCILSPSLPFPMGKVHAIGFDVSIGI